MNKLFKVLQSINNEIVNALSEENTSEVDTGQISLKSYTLDNGDIINVEGELAVGAIVTDSDGNPYPDGEYHLEDGSLVRCEGGIITEYVPISDSDEEQSKQKDNKEVVSDTQKKDLTNTIMDTNKTKDKDSKSLTIDLELGSQAKLLASLTESITDLQTQLTELKTQLDSQSKVNSDLLKQIEIIGGQPSQKAVVNTDQPEDKGGVPEDPYERDRYFTKKAQERLLAMKKAK